MVILGPDDCRTIDNHHLINSGLSVSPFETLVCGDTSGAHVKIEKAHPAHVAAIATIASKAGATAVAHPEGRLVMFLIEHTVIVYVVARR